MPDFTILGRGRVGRALAQAWGGRIPLLPGSTTPEGLVLLALPDSALEGAAQRFPGRCVHLSGSLQLEGVPSAHPLASFTGAVADWQGIPLALTGSVPEVVVQAFRDLGFLPFDLAPAHKALYHACAVLTSGHAATLWLGAQALLAREGISLPGRGLMALAQGTQANVEALGERGRTGPFVRQDLETILRDADALPEPWRHLFLVLGRALD